MNHSAQYSQLFNAIPVPMFIVDNDIRILDSNAAADSAFGITQGAIRTQSGGELLGCLHLQDVAEGCGKGPACKSCVIRNSVSSCLDAVTTTQQRMKLELQPGAKKADLDLLISASPLPEAGENAVLLIVEDITAICKLLQAIEPEAEYLYPDPDPYPAEELIKTKLVA
jgi:PAS domain-containing protein